MTRNHPRDRVFQFKLRSKVMKKRVLVPMIMFLVIVSSAFSQGTKGMMGIGVGIRTPGANFGLVPNADIIVPIWLTSKMVLQPRLGLSKETGTQFRLGTDFYYHFREADKMSPYLTGALILFFDNKAFTGGSSQTDFMFNMGIGAEYFWHEKASIAGDTGFMLAQSGATGADAFIGTYGQIVLRWYLK